MESFLPANVRFKGSTSAALLGDGRNRDRLRQDRDFDKRIVAPDVGRVWADLFERLVHVSAPHGHQHGLRNPRHSGGRHFRAICPLVSLTSDWAAKSPTSVFPGAGIEDDSDIRVRPFFVPRTKGIALC
jgi:hypothetical protein